MTIKVSTVGNTGGVQFNTYGAGTLVTDASGNITVSSGGGAGGPYLPLAGGTMTGTAGVLMPDNFKLNLGTSSDLQIYHDGSNSFMVDAGAGDMLHYYSNDWKVIKYGTGELSIWATTDAGVKLYYDNVKKFETTSTGVTVAGNISFGDSHFIGDDADDNLLIQGSASENVIIRSEDGLYFRTGGNNTRLSINSSGNVGIGTTSPSKKLDVNGQTQFYEYTGAHLTNQATSNFNFNTLANNAASTNGGSVGAYIKLTGTPPGATGRWSAFRARAYGENAKGNTDDMINFFAEYRNYTSTNAVTLSHHAGLKVNSLGVGGLATVTNNYGVYLNPGTAATNNYGVYQLGTGVKNFFQGNVGIGTTSPNRKLSVYQSSSSLVADFRSASGNNSHISLSNNASTADQVRIGSASSSLVLSTNYTERMRITDSGNVGIGTTSPGVKLDVSGQIRSNDSFLLQSGTTAIGSIRNQGGALDIRGDSTRDVSLGSVTSPQALFVEGTNGNVGIGTTSPSEKLHVKGNILVEDNDSTDTVAQIGNSGDDGWLNLYANGTSKAFIGANAVSYFNGGNVGIGTTSPSEELEVSGDISIKNKNGSNPTDAGSLYFKEAGSDWGSSMYGFRINSDGSSNILKFQGAAFAVVKDILTLTRDTGRVGIGTNSPTYKLHVQSPDANDDVVYIHHDNAAQSSGTLLKVRTDAGDSNGYTLLDVQNNSGSALFVRGDRKVGIGTTSPDTILHVKGSTDSTEVKIDTNDNALGDNALIKFNGERAQVGWIDAAVTLTDGGGNKDIKLKVNTGSIFLQTNNTNRLSVLDGGNVGIGTNSPGQKLDVNGSINVSSNVFAEGFYGDRLWNSNNAALRFGANNTERARIDGNGNLGIGTTAPTNKLHIQGSQATVYSSTDSGGQASAGTTINNTNTSGNTNNFSQLLFTVGTNNNSLSRIVAIRSGSDASDLAFVGKSAAGVAEYMRIKSGGNVGIGTTSPSEKLHVDDGDVIVKNNSTNQYKWHYDSNQPVWSIGGGNYFTIKGGGNRFVTLNSSGNFGIGTTSPSYKLDVNGVVRGDRFFVGTNTAASQWAFHARNNNSTADSGLYFNNNSSEIYLRNSSNVIGARIRSNSASYFNGGDVGIGTASPQERLHVSGETHPSIKLSSSSDGNYNVILNCGYRNEALNLSVGGYKVFTTEGFNTPETTHLYSNNSKALSLASNQAATFTSTVTATNFINSSDERLKENIEEVRNNNVEVNWKTFNFKTEKEQKRYGVIAQELEKTNPEFVREDSQGFKSVAYIDLLIAKIAELEARIQKLEK